MFQTSNLGVDFLTKWILGKEPSCTLLLHLFSSDTPFGPDMVLTQFTQPIGGGYAPIVLQGTKWHGGTFDLTAKFWHEPVNFNFLAYTGIQKIIRGWIISVQGTPIIISARRLVTPYVVAYTGAVFQVLPEFYFGVCATIA